MSDSNTNELADGFHWYDGHLIYLRGDYWTRWLPNRTVRHILKSYWQTYSKPHFFRGDPVLWPGVHFSWWELGKETVRLLFFGYREYRWD